MLLIWLRWRQCRLGRGVPPLALSISHLASPPRPYLNCRGEGIDAWWDTWIGGSRRVCIGRYEQRGSAIFHFIQLIRRCHKIAPLWRRMEAGPSHCDAVIAGGRRNWREWSPSSVDEVVDWWWCGARWGETTVELRCSRTMGYPPTTSRPNPRRLHCFSFAFWHRSTLRWTWTCRWTSSTRHLPRLRRLFIVQLCTASSPTVSLGASATSTLLHNYCCSGTFGYLDPMYYYTCRLTGKTQSCF